MTTKLSYKGIINKPSGERLHAEIAGYAEGLTTGYIAFYGQPVLKASGQGHFVGIFQFAAKGNATGNGGDADVEWLSTGSSGQLLLDIIDSRIALYIRIKGKYEFFCFFFFYPVNQ
jgi:hypothetical protein